MSAIPLKSSLNAICVCVRCVRASRGKIARQVSVTKLRAGDAYNVVPDTAVIGGTIRRLSLSLPLSLSLSLFLSLSLSLSL